MKKTSSISVLHVIFLSMTVIGLKNHVTIIPSLVQGAGRDGWISILVAVIIIFPWLFLVLYIHKKSKRQPLTEWLEKSTGKVASAIIRYMTAIFLLILAAFTMGETLIWIISTFLPETPVLPLLLIYTILCILLATTNLQTIAMVNVLILFWIVILGFFIAFTNMQVKDYELLQPFFEHGFQPVLTTAVFPASGFVEIILFLFIQQQVKDQIRWYHFAVMLFILMGLTMGPTIGAITEFGPTEVTKQRFPAYEEWGIGSVGRFIEHFDFASIYQWLSGTFIRVSLLLFIAADLLKMTGDKQRIWRILAPAFFFMALSLNLLSDDLFHSIKGDYLLIVTFFFMFFLSFILVIIALLSRKSSKKIKT
ncbi:spore gernimation protein [Sporosarcina sp. P18a]|uniref:GerAB/ArcD/ProY family transporter n=1 Tax=Sporosarcina sp. P18a TaxID=2048259 RepID=UPI000C16ADB5|nr:endospore germination permease [Sporosarcina sp. P18a]PIC79624.1 spore gernimation protein [Sporosarcina sp. P18a]